MLALERMLQVCYWRLDLFFCWRFCFCDLDFIWEVCVRGHNFYADPDDTGFELYVRFQRFSWL